jgi:hypothetical protein
MIILIFAIWLIFVVLILRAFAVSSDLNKKIAKHPKSKQKTD